MKNQGVLDPDKLSLLRVDIVSGSIDNPLEIRFEDVKETRVDLGYATGFNLEQKVAKVELEIRVSTVFDKDPQAHARFRLAYLFSIENLEELVEVSDNQTVEVSDQLAFALANISYSTTRGILFARFQATAFRNFILPVISPKDILDANMEEEGERN